MKVYTFFTESHRKILDLFLENFPYSPDIELNIKFLPQECSTGSFMKEGWNFTMKRKVEYVLQALHETEDGEWFVHSDCDIILFDGWLDILDKFKDSVDMMIQNDHTCLCAGFFFCKKNEKTLKLWNAVLNNLTRFENDQVAMNYFISQFKEVLIGVLPDNYFTYGLLGRGVWDNAQFSIPDVENLKMFHANWAEGISSKLELMRKSIEDRKL